MKGYYNMNKQCLICDEIKDTEEGFYKQKEYLDGHQNVCKVCQGKRFLVARARRWSADPKAFLVELYHQTKATAFKATKAFDITHTELIEIYNEQKGLCKLSGRVLEVPQGTKYRSNTTMSVCLINAYGTYSKDNIQLVCYAVFKMKNNLTNEQLKSWCKDIDNLTK